MTLTPNREGRTGRQHRVRRPTRSIPYRVTAALASYVDATTDALARWEIPVTGVDVTTRGGVLGARIRLAERHDAHTGPVPAELRWFETTGWELALQPTGEPEPVPWRFLHFGLVPTPAHVASFTHGLLRGEDLGMPYPARFRRPGDSMSALVDLLRRCSRDARGTGMSPTRSADGYRRAR